MNKELLEKRLSIIEDHIKNINNEIKKNVTNLNILEGGKQECLYWINIIDSFENNDEENNNEE